jgi:hypothetical protein
MTRPQLNTSQACYYSQRDNPTDNFEKRSLLLWPALLRLLGSANTEVANNEEQTQYQEHTEKNEVDEAVE